MARQLDPAIADVLRGYGYGADAAWDCHGTWVVYHKVLEQIAAKAGITFDPPQVIEANAAGRIVSLCVTGRKGDRVEWSIGEAAPNNNKNAYPYAMAEKRAKDRVILKLIGLHGVAYSEDEADDFRESRPSGAAPTTERKSAAQAKRDGDNETVKRMIEDATTVEDLDARWGVIQSDWLPALPKSWFDHIQDYYETKRDALKEMETA